MQCVTTYTMCYYRMSRHYSCCVWLSKCLGIKKPHSSPPLEWVIQTKASMPLMYCDLSLNRIRRCYKVKHLVPPTDVFGPPQLELVTPTFTRSGLSTSVVLDISLCFAPTKSNTIKWWEWRVGSMSKRNTRQGQFVYCFKWRLTVKGSLKGKLEERRRTYDICHH